MADEKDPDELQRALARPDASKLIEQIDAYIEYFANGAGDWPEERSDDFTQILTCVHDDPDLALAYVLIGAARTDHAAFLRLMGQSFEPLLNDPTPEFLARVVAEARRSARFRWVLSNPVKESISDVAWDAIETLRFTGPHEEPSPDLLPPRILN